MLREVCDLIRVRQWYKGLVIFLPIVFIGNFFKIDLLILTAIGFFALCFVSSVNYIINDLVDLEKDRVNPEKTDRPLVSGAVKRWQAALLAIILFCAAILIALVLSRSFAASLIVLLLVGQAYNFFLRKEAFADILAIAVMFVIRAVSGTFIIGSDVSPWLVLCTFLLSMFLSVSKRAGEVSVLGENAGAHRATLAFYTKEVTNSSMIVATTSLIVSYSFYSFLSNKNLLLTLPFALYVILRYFYLTYSSDRITRHPEDVFHDSRMLLGIIMWTLLIFAILYFKF